MINSNIRIEIELWNKLKEIAFKEKRSVNQQINYIIQKYVEEKKDN